MVKRRCKTSQRPIQWSPILVGLRMSSCSGLNYRRSERRRSAFSGNYLPLVLLYGFADSDRADLGSSREVAVRTGSGTINARTLPEARSTEKPRTDRRPAAFDRAVERISEKSLRWDLNCSSLQIRPLRVRQLWLNPGCPRGDLPLTGLKIPHAKRPLRSNAHHESFGSIRVAMPTRVRPTNL
jgi:hypothetical protein